MTPPSAVAGTTYYRDQHASHVSWSGKGGWEGEGILEQNIASPHEFIIAHFHLRIYPPSPPPSDTQTCSPIKIIKIKHPKGVYGLYIS